MNQEEREQKINKVIKYTCKDDAQNSDVVRKYAEKLDDNQLVNFVRLTGEAASSHQSEDRLFSIKSWVNRDPQNILPFLIENVGLKLSDDDYDYLTSLFKILKSYGHPTVHGSKYWNAHLTALKRYDAIDASDKWFYDSNHSLVELVDAHPEDVEAIMRLREQFKLRVVTEENLSEYKLTHAALADGLL